MLQTIFVLLIFFLFNGITLGQGVILPIDRALPPATLAYQRVNVVIEEQAAETRIEQEFKNTSSRPMEGTYVFPVPAGATVSDFALWVDGKRTKGELIDATQARQIYTDIVRRLQDPALLERMEDRLFRVRVFPIPPHGTQKIEIAYSQVIPKEQGLAEFVYPRLASAGGRTSIEKDFTLRVELASKSAIKNVYSPSHSVGISRDGDRRVIVGMEEAGSAPVKDFHLLWSTDDEPIGISAMTYRENLNEEGYLLLLLSPGPSVAPEERVPRDLVFVVDTSGSMAGEKMDQARGALKHCIGRLGESDRFGIVRFSTTAELWKASLVPMSTDTRAEAGRWIDQLEARGGTAIAAALESAFSLRSSDGRPLTVVFLTDGQPTIGITEPKSILEGAKRSLGDSARLFAFGIGDDVNAPLLDQLADQGRGTTTYVHPQENLEIKVSSFFDKVSYPVLTDLALSFVHPSIVVREVYPPKLPDLFHGSQLVVVARYQGAGDLPIHLEGSAGTTRKQFDQTVKLLPEPAGRGFVSHLWAQRKVGYLLDQIRLHGENKELVDEVKSVAKKFGIVTPYTSYLVTPDERPSPAVASPFPLPVPRSADEPSRYDQQPVAQEEAGLGLFKNQRLGMGGGSTKRDQIAHALPEAALRETTGTTAIDVAQMISAMKQAETSVAATERLGKRSFRRVAGVWLEDSIDPSAEVVRIRYLGTAYFELADSEGEIGKILSLGGRVAFRSPTGVTVVIDGEGLDEWTTDQRRLVVGH